jgi:XTP/dITP diphosphohydrolase
MNQPIFLATGNAHKAREFAAMFAAAALPWTIESAAALGGMPSVEETATTFAGNAMLKARALRSKAKADAWVLADDSGLEVDALGRAPGVFSARYAGPEATDADNTAKLLREMDGFPPRQRRARFVCVLALIDAAGGEHTFLGACRGRIGTALTGAGGFGYDPVFYPEGQTQTYAELGDEVKNRLSHRGKALEKLFAYLRSRAGQIAVPDSTPILG